MGSQWRCLAVLTPEHAACLDGLPEEIVAAMMRTWAFERRAANGTHGQVVDMGSERRTWQRQGAHRGWWLTERIKAGSVWNHLLSRTPDVGDTMIQGESGLIEVAPRWH
jgi:hypothetical protein